MILVQGDERMVKLSPAQLRQRRMAARARDHEAGFAAGHSPRSVRRRRAATLLGATALVAVGVPAYRQAGRIHPQDLGSTRGTNLYSGKEAFAHPGPRSASVGEASDRMARMRRGAKAKRKAK